MNKMKCIFNVLKINNIEYKMGYIFINEQKSCYNNDIMKNKWLRVRLNDQQDEVLERYASFEGISRSEVVRRIIDALPSHPEEDQPSLKINKLKGGRICMEVKDSDANRYSLSVVYKRDFNLWRIALQKLGRFNQPSLTAQVDLVQEKNKPNNTIWLNYIVPSIADNWEETDEMLWDAVEKLRVQEGWTRMYGELTLEMIEKNPKQLSWLKSKGFEIRSEAEQDNLEFCCNFS